MCRVLRVNRAGYYAWLKSPNSERAKEDQRLLGLIKHHWLASGSVYGHRKITMDLRDLGERCSRHRVHRRMRTEDCVPRWAMVANRASMEECSARRRPTCLTGSST
ncbi:putative transposase [Xanthomonas campestris]|nr:putative transposase [Xanthomonas sp. 3075]